MRGVTVKQEKLPLYKLPAHLHMHALNKVQQEARITPHGVIMEIEPGIAMLGFEKHCTGFCHEVLQQT